MTAFKTVMIKLQDHVAVALSEIPAGAEVEVVCQGSQLRVTLSDSIEFGHSCGQSRLQNASTVGRLCRTPNRDRAGMDGYPRT